MAVGFRNESHVVGTGTSPTLTDVTGAAQNDLYLALAVAAKGNTLTAPAGWTQLYSAASTTSFDMRVHYIRRGSSAPSLAWTHTGSVYREVHVLAFTGVDMANPIDASSAAGTFYTAASTNPNPGAAVAAAANAMSVAIAVYWAGSATGGWTAPAGYTIRSNNAVGNDAVMASKLLTAAGSEDPAAFANGVVGASSDGWNGATVILRPASRLFVPVMALQAVSRASVY